MMGESLQNQDESVKFIAQEWKKIENQIQTQARTHAKVKSIHKHGPITYIDKKTAYPVSISYQTSEQ